MVLERINFQNKKGHILQGITQYIEKETLLPAVILLHDLNSHSQHELIINLSNFLVAQGLLVLRFDFHGHGSSEGTLQEFNITQQMDDLNCAIDYLKTLDIIDSNKIGIYGHGMGADAAIIAIADDEKTNIACMILHAPRADLNDHINSRFLDIELEEMKQKGFIKHGIHGRIDRTFFDNLKKHAPLDEIQKIKIPLLFIHGTNDFAIPVVNSKSLFLKAIEPKRLELVEGADHEFRNVEHREYFFEVCSQWFNKWLKGSAMYSYKY
ncbi:prolyl oligopeptidase family serine peptidase [Candidatus Woesearchaeota archaeon]|jgi:uncharacterized protein|nr:prolyl oligopeptidase family serine peptidase [Candidatus Woesearchaeota archaeon]